MFALDKLVDIKITKAQESNNYAAEKAPEEDKHETRTRERMAPANFTEATTEQRISRELFCSAEFTAEVHNELIFLSALNVLLSITAFLGNILILAALRKETSLHPPSKLLYRNLAVTDLCVAITAEPLTITYWMSVVNQRWDLCHFANVAIFVTAATLCSSSLFTVTAISMDRLLALLLGLKYRQVVTLKKTSITVIVLWILSIVATASYFWKPYMYTWLFQVGLFLPCLVVSCLSYTKIFLTLRQKEKHVREQQGQEIPEGIARYRKAVSSSLWLLVALVVCYLPYGIAAPLTPYNAFWWEINHCIYSNVYLKFSNLNKINVCKVKNIYGREKRKNTYRKLYHQSLQLLKKSNKNTVRINRTYSIIPMLLY